MATLIDKMRNGIQQTIDKKSQKSLSAQADKVISLYEKKYITESTNKDGKIVSVLNSNIDFEKELNDLRSRIQNGESLDKILPEVYALVMAASEKVFGFHHRKCQIECAIALHEGRVAELATGEGKTLSATLTAVLHAITGDPVHIVTANEYLAKRDADSSNQNSMYHIYNLLGLTTGYIISSQDKEIKKQNYGCDIVYSTASELGFDYLRDNMAKKIEDKVARGYGFAIVDEADDVLIDDATTPLIISESIKSPSFKSDIIIADLLTQAILNYPELKMTKDTEADEDDYDLILDDQYKTIHITERGSIYIENVLLEIIKATSFDSFDEALDYIKNESNYLRHIVDYKNILDLIKTINLDTVLKPFIDEVNENKNEIDPFVTKKCSSLLLMLNNSLKAKVYMKDQYTVTEKDVTFDLYSKDNEYLGKRKGVLKKVELFSLESGRIMEGRQYSDGLNQAIEVYELGINGITDESISKATITLPSFFKQYTNGICGMTGTAKSSEDEFTDIYGLTVVSIEPFKKSVRSDEPASAHVFLNKSKKYAAIVEDALNAVRDGRPVLITASSLDECNNLNEIISSALKAKGVTAEVRMLTPLTAPTLSEEANIISEAGKAGRITISTNMAGRGTDISLKPADVIPEDIKSVVEKNVFIALRKYFLSNSKNYTEDLKEFQKAYNEFVDGKNISNKRFEILPKKYNEFLEREKNKLPEGIKRYYNLPKDELNNLRENLYDKTNKAGGLRVIITEYPENSRVEGQMRGRAGRQGDNGSTAVYISLEDNFLKNAYPESYSEIVGYVIKNLQKSVDDPKIIKKIYDEVASLFDITQKQIESRNMSSRKLNTGFDDVIDIIRGKIYGIRDSIINGEFNITEYIPDYIKSIVSDSVDKCYNGYETDVDSLNAELRDRTSNLCSASLTKDDCGIYSINQLKVKLLKQVVNIDEMVKKANLTSKSIESTIGPALLEIIDKNWVEFIDELVFLRKTISLDTIGQKDINQAFINKFASLRNIMEMIIKEEVLSKFASILSNESVNNNNTETKKTTSDENYGK